MINRITQLKKEEVPQGSLEMLGGIQQKFGRIPNVFKVMANSPAVLKSYLEYSGALQNASLDAKIAEKIAVMTAAQNGCEYCLSVHSFIQAQMGESEKEILNNRNKISVDTKTQAALEFAYSVLKNAGNVTDEELENIKAEGFSEAEVLEIVAAVVLNILTNSLNNLAKPVLDFPKLKEPLVK